MSITWHRHHIIPKHAGGTDDPDNILKCNVAMHAFLHEQLYKEHCREEDRLAYRGLRGIHSRQDHLREVARYTGSLGGHARASINREPEYKLTFEDRSRGGVKNAKSGHLGRIGKLHSQKEHKCPNCNKVGSGNGMFRWHFDNCKSKL